MPVLEIYEDDSWLTTGPARCRTHGWVRARVRIVEMDNGSTHVGLYCSRCNAWCKWQSQEPCWAFIYGFTMTDDNGRRILSMLDYDAETRGRPTIDGPADPITQLVLRGETCKP